MVFRHVSVHLSGCQVSVPEQFLNRAEIGPSLQEVRGEGVAKGVGMQNPTVRQGVSLQNTPGITGTQAASPLVQEKSIRRACRLDKPRTPILHVVEERQHGRLTQGDTADFRSLAQHRDGTCPQIAVTLGKAAQLAHSQPGPVKNLDDRVVAQHKWVGSIFIGRLGSTSASPTLVTIVMSIEESRHI